jgi:hypothetical protein
MRKHSHKVLFKITNKQVEAIERQYWAKYNNDTLESMLFYKQNTNQ